MANPLSLAPAEASAMGGTSKDDVSGFPKEVRQRVGGALWEAQIGRKASYARPLKGFGGAGVSKSSTISTATHFVLSTQCASQWWFTCCTRSRRNPSMESQRLGPSETRSSGA
jgi:hypothetical protein